MAKGDTDRQLAEKHKYRLPSGEIAINVTAISGLMDDGKSGAFAGAAMKLRDQGLNYREVWKAKADRGTRVHGHLESFLRGEDIDQADDEKGFVDALEKFILDYNTKVIAQEEIVLSNLGYGGRFDLIAEINAETALIDLKTGSAYPAEHALQLSAYRFADGMASYDNDGNLTELRRMPPIDWCGCLYVKEDGTYNLDRYPADGDTFEVFCALLQAYKWTRTDTMKALKKEAMGR
jgi:hypothetical protein